MTLAHKTPLELVKRLHEMLTPDMPFTAADRSEALAIVAELNRLAEIVERQRRGLNRRMSTEALEESRRAITSQLAVYGRIRPDASQRWLVGKIAMCTGLPESRVRRILQKENESRARTSQSKSDLIAGNIQEQSQC